MGDGVDGRVGVQVVCPQAEGKVPAELDVVDANFEVDDAGGEAGGPSRRVCVQVRRARRRQVVV